MPQPRSFSLLHQTQTGLKALLSEIDATEIMLLQASSELLFSHSGQQETNMKDAHNGFSLPGLEMCHTQRCRGALVQGEGSK